jgi:Zn-dependent protease
MKGGTLRVGTIAGIPQELKFSWAIIFALLAWSLATGYFPSAVPDLSAGSYWSKGILAALLLFASILAHELGHALIARREGVRTRRTVLFAFGGVAELNAEPPGPGAEFRIAVAGYLAMLKGGCRPPTPSGILVMIPPLVRIASAGLAAKSAPGG